MNLFDSVVAGKLAGGVGDLLIKTGSDTLTWDGNTEGLVCVADVYYKVSDNIVTSADWPNGIRVNFAGVFYEIPPTGMIELSEGAFFSEVATFIAESAVGIDIQGRVFPESGVYFTAIGGQYTSSLTIPGYDGFNKKETINPKYLPETGGGVSSWNDLTDKPFYEETANVALVDGEYESQLDNTFGVFAVSALFDEELPELLENFTLTLDGTAYNISQITEIPSLGNLFGNLYLLNAIAGTSFPNTGEPFLGAIDYAGVSLFFLESEPTKHNVKLTVLDKVFHTISSDFVSVPTFDLNEMGLPEIPNDGKSAEAYVESADFYKALRKGCVQIRFAYLGQKCRAFVCANYYESSTVCAFTVPTTQWSVIQFNVYRGLINDNTRAITHISALKVDAYNETMN